MPLTILPITSVVGHQSHEIGNNELEVGQIFANKLELKGKMANSIL